jgi:hypothetical protein
MTFAEIIEGLVYEEDISEFKSSGGILGSYGSDSKPTKIKSYWVLYNSDCELKMSNPIKFYYELFMDDLNASQELVIDIYLSNEPPMTDKNIDMSVSLFLTLTQGACKPHWDSAEIKT